MKYNKEKNEMILTFKEEMLLVFQILKENWPKQSFTKKIFILIFSPVFFLMIAYGSFAGINKYPVIKVNRDD